jgi:hypothetical protein
MKKKSPFFVSGYAQRTTLRHHLVSPFTEPLFQNQNYRNVLCSGLKLGYLRADLVAALASLDVNNFSHFLFLETFSLLSSTRN